MTLPGFPPVRFISESLLLPGGQLHTRSKLSLLRNRTKENRKRVRMRSRKLEGQKLSLSEGVGSNPFHSHKTRICLFVFSVGMEWGVGRCLGRAVLTRWLTDEAIWGQGKCHPAFCTNRSFKGKKTKHHQHAYGDISLPHSKANDSRESYGAKMYILAT